MIFLTELANLTEGLYWARRIGGEHDFGRSKWTIICIVGSPPFLDGYVIAYRADEVSDATDMPWRNGYERREGRTERFGASEWEFGPRIDIPSDKERVEYAPQPAQERMLVQ